MDFTEVAKKRKGRKKIQVQFQNIAFLCAVASNQVIYKFKNYYITHHFVRILILSFSIFFNDAI